MATPVAESSARNDVELPPAVHWPTVYVMAGVGGGLAAVLLAVALIAAAQTPPAPHPVETVTPVAVVLPPPHHSLRTVKPAASAETSSDDAGRPAWKPLVPHPAPPTPVQAPAPRLIVAAEPILSPETKTASPPATATTSEGRSDSEPFADLQARAPVLDLNTMGGTSALLLAQSADNRGKRESVVDLIAHREDLAGLPLRGARECTLSTEEAEVLGEISPTVRRIQARLDRDRLRKASADDGGASERLTERDRKFIDFLGSMDLGAMEEGQAEMFIPGLTQMLCVESPPVRLQLTNMLAATRGQKASLALAHQALFDQEPEVRIASVKALKVRPRSEYRQALLGGFRYPWPPVADRAAEALIALDDRDAAPALEKMLDLPDPAAPVLNDKKKWVKAEVVKVNHLRNCLLCHAPSTSADDRVRGFIPKPGEAIPVLYCAQPDGDFVRADVTYLRQDFSVMEPVLDPGKWPSIQRFDYLVRRRVLSDREVYETPEAGPSKTESYPQREAVRLALEKLKQP